MKFYALFGGYMVMTDDYSKEEIKKNLHIKHIENDVKQANVGHNVDVILLDENFAKINEFVVA